jgi:hypothetical protein
MNRNLEPCCVCDQPKPRRKDMEYLAACADCEGVYRICFTSVGDAKTAIARASLADLKAAEQFEVKHSCRVSLLNMIARQIRKLGKANKESRNP